MFHGVQPVGSTLWNRWRPPLMFFFMYCKSDYSRHRLLLSNELSFRVIRKVRLLWVSDSERRWFWRDFIRVIRIVYSMVCPPCRPFIAYSASDAFSAVSMFFSVKLLPIVDRKGVLLSPSVLNWMLLLCRFIVRWRLRASSLCLDRKQLLGDFLLLGCSTVGSCSTLLSSCLATLVINAKVDSGSMLGSITTLFQKQERSLGFPLLLQLPSINTLELTALNSH